MNTNKKHGGFTLIEILVAISIFAVLSLGSWKVLTSTISASQTIRERSAQLQQLQKAMWVISKDLYNTVDRPIRDNFGTIEPSLTSTIPNYSLLLTRGGWTNPLDAQRSDLQRVGYSLESSQAGRYTLVRSYWSVLDRSTQSIAKKQILLNHIGLFETQFIDASGRTHFHWPPNRNPSDDNYSSIPAGIRIKIKTQDYGEVVKLFNLRSPTRE